MSASELEEKVKAKRFRAAPTHCWSSGHTRSLLEEVRGEIKDRPESFEKPIAQKFYSKISDKCPLLANINWKVMKSKMRYLKGVYMEAVKWRSQTGAGLIENGEEESVKDYIQNICPFFEILDEIFGLRKGVNPTVIIESSNIEVLNEDSEEVFLFDNVDDISNSYSSSRISASTPIPPDTPQPDVHLSLELSSNNASSFNGDSEIENLKKRMTSKHSLKKKQNPNASSAGVLQGMLEAKLDLEKQKFDWMKEKEKQELEMKKLEIERDERLALAKMKLENEREEKLKMYELELKYKKA